jgi:hypothetical protein
MSFRNDDDFDSESYVRVNTRLNEFHAKYPEGRVETSYTFHEERLVMKAALFANKQDEKPIATGHAFLESLTGDKVGEYTETVAVGRALALAGFKIEKSLASGEEMVRFKERQESKREEKQETKSTPAPRPRQAAPAQQAESKVEEKAEPLAKAEIKDTPTEVKKLTTSRIFKPLPKKDAQQQ